MRPEEFKKDWTAIGDKTIPISLNNLEGFDLLPSTVEFLSNSGLPDAAAPLLNFIQEDSNNPERGIASVTKSWDFLGVEYKRFVNIGFDSLGSPIVIDPASDDMIIGLDHDYDFEPFFINESIEKLAGCLLAYRGFIENVNSRNGESAWLDGNYSQEDIDKLANTLEKIDPAAMEEEAFWSDEISSLVDTHLEFKEDNKE